MKKCCDRGQSSVRDNLTIPEGLKCNPENPVCLYDFTTRATVIHHLVYKVDKPVNIIHDYFGEDDSEHFDIPIPNKKRDNRRESSDKGLLIGRKMHLCREPGFEKSFQMLFNKDVTKMFESLTLFYQYINEKSGIMLSNQFIKETKDSCTDIECQSFCSEFSDSVRKCDDALEDPCEFAFDSLLNQGDQSEHILEQCQLDSGEMASERKSLSKCMQFSTLKMAEKISEIRSLQMANKILSGDVNILDSYRFEDS